ncbi:glycosyltransferase family 4 protein [Eubacteriaceae bacterium ES3]|nr:glycosyltransferase family 4 protein [Eubacteriaceae bacterium ES3]
MKNILFVHSSSEMYGSDRSLLNIVKYIDKSKFNIFVILPCPGQLVDEMKKVPGVKVEIFEIAVLRRNNFSIKGGGRYFKEFINSYKYLKKFIKTYKIDIVDTNTGVVLPGAIVAKHSKIKSVWHIREIIKNDMENKVISMIMNRYANLIVANSKSTGIALKVNQKCVRVVYNAVEEKKNTIQQPHDYLVVGMAGRINRWKGQKLLVDAAEIVHEKMPDVIFKIAGEAYSGEEYLKVDLHKYIEEKELTDTVILLGQVNDMSSFYGSLDLFVLPSTQPEPFGLVVIEAMEFGLPVIATNHGGPVEIIDEGVDGYLVDYESPNQMATRIIDLMLDERKRKQMGVKGQEKKRNNFSAEAMVKNIESVFNEAISIR